MRVLVAQMLELMRCEIDDEEATAGRENARSLGQGAARIIEIMQYLMDGHEIGAGAWKGQSIDVGLAHLSVAQPGSFKIRTRDDQHFAAFVDPRGLGGVWRQKRQNAPG